MTHIETMKQALEALERSVATCFDQYAHRMVMSQPEHFIHQAITSLRQAIANEALNKKAENARELGLDYEPSEQKPTLLLDGKTVQEACLLELYEFQKATGCNTASEFEAEKQEPFGIWHQGPTYEESDFHLYSESGDVSCPDCIKLYTHPQPKVKQEPVIDGNTSDGYHTFNELYEFRKAYNAALFNELAFNNKCSVHKSWRHHDGELCFGGGWFIVVAVLPNGQISNHYEAKDWSLFQIPEVEKALFEFDGHTGEDVIARLKSYTHPQPNYQKGQTD